MTNIRIIFYSKKSLKRIKLYLYKGVYRLENYLLRDIYIGEIITNIQKENFFELIFVFFQYFFKNYGYGL